MMSLLKFQDPFVPNAKYLILNSLLSPSPCSSILFSSSSLNWFVLTESMLNKTKTGSTEPYILERGS